MRFCYARHKQVCKHCKTTIDYGDEMVVVRWRSPSNIIIPLVVHAACYIPWEEATFNKRWKAWKLGATPRRIRRKRGRKFKYSSRLLAGDMNRVKSLMNYHRKVGNEGRVQELQREIDKLERT